MSRSAAAPLVEVRRKRIDGRSQRAVFTTRAIRAGETIGTFEGDLFTRDQILALIASGEIRDGVDPLEIGPDLYLRAEEPLLRVNHSCEPNAGLAGRCDLVALRDLAADEEVTCDYATNSSVRNAYVMPFECRCGAPTCRRRIGNLASIPFGRLRLYLEAGALQDYIRGEAVALLAAADGSRASTAKAPARRSPANG